MREREGLKQKGWRQFDQIGRFLKVLCNNFSYTYLGYFDVYHFLRKNYYVYFFGHLLEFLAYFKLQLLVTLDGSDYFLA